jgi:hypothetical protein
VEERADAGPVALGVGQDDERRIILVVDHSSTRLDGGGNALLGHVVGQPHVDVEALSWSLVRISVLEPQDRHATGGVTYVVTLE